MKKIVVFIFFMFIISLNVYAQTQTKIVTFSRCVDGDTAVFLDDEEEVKYRFLAIDTPESVHPTKAVEEYGKNASEYTCNILTNAKEIIIEYETKNKTDKYGRYLGWIWVDGALLQEKLVSIGYAEVAYIYGSYRYTNSLCLAQSTAHDNSLGIWDGTREVGYCSTINLKDVKSNIDYSLINDSPIDDKEDKTSKKTDKKISDTEKKINEKTEIIEKLIDNIDDDVLMYIVIAAAIISIIIKKIKKSPDTK